MSEERKLTTPQGHPVFDNQNLRTIGDRGPARLENHHFLEQLSHLDRERVALATQTLSDAELVAGD